MIKSAYIRGISYYLPDKTVTNKDFAEEFPEWAIEKIATQTGIDTRHIASADETASDMSVKAAELFFEEHDISPALIDFVLLCTQSPDYFLPSSSCIVQERLGIPNSAGAFDFNLGCSGYIYGLSIAKGFIAAGVANNILLLTSDTICKYLDPEDKSTRTIFGDAATATLISTEGLALIDQFHLGTDGSGAESLIVKNGASRYPLDFERSRTSKSQDDYLYMNGIDVFGFTLNVVPDLINSVLQANQISKSEVDLFVFHQANKFIMESLRNVCEVDSEKFYYCLEYGNTVSSTIPIALKHAWNDSSIEHGSRVLAAGFGVGFSYGGVLLRYINTA